MQLCELRGVSIGRRGLGGPAGCYRRQELVKQEGRQQWRTESRRCKKGVLLIVDLRQQQSAVQIQVGVCAQDRQAYGLRLGPK